MPVRRRYRSKKSSRAPRRSYRKRGGRRGRKMKASISRIPGINLPDRMFLKMPFSFMSTFTFTASGAFQNLAYSGTSIIDPGILQSTLAASGVQQWSTLYDNFRTYGSSITAKFMSAQDPTLPSAVRVGIIPVDTDINFNSLITDFNQAISQKYAKFKVYNATTSFPTIRHAMGSAKMQGVNKEAVRDDSVQYAGTFPSTSPQKSFNWYVFAQPLASTTMTINVQVRVVFSVELFGRRPLLQV